MSAGLKYMKEHVKAVQNIQKITQSMKVVSAAKFAKYDKILRLARPLGLAANQFYALSNLKRELIPPHISFFAVTSDRGLCGSMHSKVCRMVTAGLQETSTNHDIICIGEKAKSILLMEKSDVISLVVNGIGHRAPTFRDASRIVTYTFKPDDYIQGNIVYPKFRNMVTFDIDQLTVYSLPILLTSKHLIRYEFDSKEDLTSYLEFSQVSLIYYCLCETYLVELSARMTAMSNAAKNAGSMTRNLKLELNRKRQQMNL